MLVVLAGGPVTTPLEAGLGEELEAEVVVGDLVGEVPRTVAVGLAGGGLDEQRAVSKGLDVGVVERVDIDSQSSGMLREIVGGGDVAVAEARRVVVAHLCLIIGIIHIGQQHALDGVLRIKQLAQDGDQAVGNHLVAHHLTHVHLVVVVPVQCPHMAQVVAADVGILLEGLALHPCPHAIGDRLGGETLIYAAEGFHIRLAHRPSCLPLCESLCLKKLLRSIPN